MSLPAPAASRDLPSKRPPVVDNRRPAPPLRNPRAMPFVMRRDAIDAPDRLRIGAHRERRGRTHDRQGFPIDTGNRVPGTLVVGVERDTRLTTPQPRLH